MADHDLQVVKERLQMGGIKFKDKELLEYLAAPDVFVGEGIPEGYKKCGHCGRVLKFLAFNKNSASKNGCTGNCKECQRESAKKSYKKTKQKRNYKKYYAEHKEEKQEQSRKYYEANKERLNKVHRTYVSSKRGKAVMQRAHSKRRESLAANAGIPYTRELVIERDTVFLGLEKPVCYLCGKPIEDLSGKGLHLDHIVSVNNGGKDCFSNIACVHSSCNLRKEKDDRHLEADAVIEFQKRSDSFIDVHPEMFE